MVPYLKARRQYCKRASFARLNRSDSLFCLVTTTPYVELHHILNHLSFLYRCNIHLCLFVYMLQSKKRYCLVIASIFEAYSYYLDLLSFIWPHFSLKGCSILVRVPIASDLEFYHICQLIGSSWKQFALHCFVFIRLKTNIVYELVFVKLGLQFFLKQLISITMPSCPHKYNRIHDALRS